MSKSIQYLTLDELIEMGESLIPDLRIRDIGLLELVLHRPETTIYGVEAYPTFPEKLAALMHSLSSNHMMIDGNKRIAWIGSRAFALINGKDFDIDGNTAEEVIKSLASGELDAKSLALIIKDWLIDG